MSAQDKISNTLVVIGLFDVIWIIARDPAPPHTGWIRLLLLGCAAVVLGRVHGATRWIFAAGLVLTVLLFWIANEGLYDEQLVQYIPWIVGMFWLVKSTWRLLADLMNEDNEAKLRWFPVGNCKYCGKPVTTGDWALGNARVSTIDPSNFSEKWSVEIPGDERRHTKLAHSQCFLRRAAQTLAEYQRTKGFQEGEAEARSDSKKDVFLGLIGFIAVMGLFFGGLLLGLLLLGRVLYRIGFLP